MTPEIQHKQRVDAIVQEMVRLLSRRNELLQRFPLSLQYTGGHSNTTRSKSYNKTSALSLNLSDLCHILRVDEEKKSIRVEPRVTMEELMKATLPLGWMVPIVPEFKGITVGGAIVGCATESTAHRWGILNDVCLSFEVLCGDGQVIHASSFENEDLFYALPGSYGSLGVLLSIELKLIPAFDTVSLQYHLFSQAQEALEFLSQRVHEEDAPDFLDGIVFSEHCCVVIEGDGRKSSSIPRFSMKQPGQEWFYQHVRRRATEAKTVIFEESMTLKEYIFRYDRGAFWMGSYLCSLPFLRRFLLEGLLGIQGKDDLHIQDYNELTLLKGPNRLLRTFLNPFVSSQHLWSLLHRAEKWVQERTMIQDFCIPETKAVYFLEDVFQGVGVFPLWLCPIKGTRERQLFAPHLLSNDKAPSHFINVGVYGLPTRSHDVPSLTRFLENKTKIYGGRKVLYSRSYYTQEEFWCIYPQDTYENFRAKFHAQGVWRDITEKVLSE